MEGLGSELTSRSKVEKCISANPFRVEPNRKDRKQLHFLTVYLANFDQKIKFDRDWDAGLLNNKCHYVKQ